MDSVSPHIVVHPCRADLTIEEEDDIPTVEGGVFTPTTEDPVIQLQVPMTLPPTMDPAMERPPSSMARLVRSLQLMKKWVALKERGSTDRDVFMERFKSAAPNIHHVYNTESKKEGPTGEQRRKSLLWGKKYLPLSPNQYILYWYAMLLSVS